MGVKGLPRSIVGAVEAVSEGRRRRPKGRIIVVVIASVAFSLPSASADEKETQSEQQEADKPLLTPTEWVETDVVIDRALTWLARNQQPDGSWGRASFSAEPAITSLAVLAFLSRGHQPDAGIYGRTIGRGVEFVLRGQGPDGALGRGSYQMYVHGICSLMLAEVGGTSSLARNRRVRDAQKRALGASLSAQNALLRSPGSRGGWGYTLASARPWNPRTGRADLSITAWVALSLRAGKNADVDVPVSAIDESIRYVLACHEPRSGAFRYKAARVGDRQITRAMSGAGILTLELCGRHRTPQALAAGEWLLKQPLATIGDEHFWYTAYYTSQAMHQLGGKYWRDYYPALRRRILGLQQPDGSFQQDRDQQGGKWGHAYATSMAVLSLAVPYRLLPIYQR